jgi:hypothetical protein
MEVLKNKGKNKGHANLKPCKPGETHNPNGRPLGTKNFKTIYLEALKKLASEEKTDPDSYEIDIIKSAVTKAKGGDIRFYQDTMDRVHGKAPQKMDVTSNGETISQEIVLKIERALEDL